MLGTEVPSCAQHVNGAAPGSSRELPKDLLGQGQAKMATQTYVSFAACIMAVALIPRATVPSSAPAGQRAAGLPAFRVADGRYRVLLTVIERADLAQHRVRFSAAVPLPRGTVSDVSHMRVQDGGKPLPCGVQELSGWADGSCRMVLLQFQVVLDAKERRELTLEFGPKVQAPPMTSHMNVEVKPHVASLSNGKLSFVWDERGLTRVLADLDNDGRPETDFGAIRMVTDLAWKQGAGKEWGAAERPVATDSRNVPATYSVIEKTPAYVTLREGHPLLGACKPPRPWPFNYVIEYTLWSGADYVDLRSYVWFAPAYSEIEKYIWEGGRTLTMVSASEAASRRAALRLEPGFAPKRVRVGVGGGEWLDTQLRQDLPLFFSRTNNAENSAAGWQVKEGAKAIKVGKGGCAETLHYEDDRLACAVVFRDFDEWGCHYFQQTGDQARWQRNCWNAHFLCDSKGIQWGFLDALNQPEVETGGGHTYWSGQRWTWKSRVRFGKVGDDPVRFAQEATFDVGYTLPYAYWAATGCLPEKVAIPPSLLARESRVVKSEGGGSRDPGSYNPANGGRRAWFTPLMERWMRTGDLRAYDAFLRETESYDLYEMIFDVWPEGGRTNSADGCVYSQSDRGYPDAFKETKYAAPTPSLWAYLLTGRKHYQEAHDRMMWRVDAEITADGFVNDEPLGPYHQQKRKLRTEGRDGHVCEYLLDEHFLQEKRYPDDPYWLRRGMTVFRYYWDLGANHAGGKAKGSDLYGRSELSVGAMFHFAQEQRTGIEKAGGDYAKEMDAMVRSQKFLWTGTFHWKDILAQYYELTGDEEVLTYLPEAASQWLDPRNTAIYVAEGRCFKDFHLEYDALAKGGGPAPSLAAAQAADSLKALYVGKYLLATALSPHHLWWYDKNPLIHPGDGSWKGFILGDNIMPGSPKWPEPGRNMRGGSGTAYNNLIVALAKAVEMQTPFLIGHDLERYWYLDQGGRFAVVDDHSKPFDPLYVDGQGEQNRFPDDQLVNPYTEKITNIVDVDATTAEITITADAGSPHNYEYWSPLEPEVIVEGGDLRSHAYDPQTQLGAFSIRHAAEPTVVRIAAPQDAIPPRVVNVWIDTPDQWRPHLQDRNYQEVLQRIANPNVDYAALRKPNIHFLTSERTRAELWYTTRSKDAKSWKALKSEGYRFRHRFDLDRLPAGTYFAKILVTDLGGNQVVEDNGGQFYRFR